MIIETERLILRPFEARDHMPYSATHADPEVMRFYPAIWSSEQSADAIQRAKDGLAKSGFDLLAVELEETGEFVGTIGIVQLSDLMQKTLSGRPQVEIGWRLQHNMWGQGFASEGAKACLYYAWEKLSLPEVVAYTAAINLPSRRVMEKIGMTHDKDADFEHPKLAQGHELRPHVLYRIKNPNLL